MPVAQAGCVPSGRRGEEWLPPEGGTDSAPRPASSPAHRYSFPGRDSTSPARPSRPARPAERRQAVGSGAAFQQPDVTAGRTVRRGCADRPRADDQAVSPARQQDHREEVAVGGRGRDTGGTADRAITGDQGQGSGHRPSINLLIHIKQALLHQPSLYLHAQLIWTRMSATGVARTGTQSGTSGFVLPTRPDFLPKPGGRRRRPGPVHAGRGPRHHGPATADARSARVPGCGYQERRQTRGPTTRGSCARLHGSAPGLGIAPGHAAGRAWPGSPLPGQWHGRQAGPSRGTVDASLMPGAS